MFKPVQQHGRNDAVAAVDIAPLIDIVFILLIFFLVTTTFVRDRGIDVVRPQATHARPLEPDALRVQVTAAGNVFVGGLAVGNREVAGRVRDYLGRNPGGAVIIVPDEQVTSKTLIAVMDQARAGGADDIALATRQPEGL